MKKLINSLLFFTMSLLIGEGFTPDTLVNTPQGYAPIEQIKTNDLVASFDATKKQIVFNPVIGVHRHKVPSYIAIKIDDEEIICSCKQKFYISTLDQWVKAEDFLADEKIRTHFCEEVAAQNFNIVKIEEQMELCAFTVKDPHNFFITKSNILAHNFVIAIPLLSWTLGEGIAFFGGVGLAGIVKALYETATIAALEEVIENLNNKEDNQKEGKAPGKPTEKDGFIPPKKWDGEKVRHPKNGKVGWPDENGNIWVPSGPNGHGGPHWDVQNPKNPKKYDNVYPGGKIRPGK